jgi:hypothetical protein
LSVENGPVISQVRPKFNPIYPDFTQHDRSSWTMEAGLIKPDGEPALEMKSGLLFALSPLWRCNFLSGSRG